MFKKEKGKHMQFCPYKLVKMNFPKKRNEET